MLLLLDRYYAGKRDQGPAHVTVNLVPALLAAGHRIQCLYTEDFASVPEFEDAYFRALADEEFVWVSSCSSPWIRRSLFRRTRKQHSRIIVSLWDAARLLAPNKTYRFYQKHYWYHDKIDRQRRVARGADVVVQFDWPDAEQPEKTVFFPTPQPTRLFHPVDIEEKRIDVSFVGDLNKFDRTRYTAAFPAIATAGGRDSERIRLVDYARILRDSKLSLNIPDFRNGIDQLNGRAFEIAACGTALLQPDGPSIRRFLEPHREFIPIESPQDFADKSRYYLEREDERRSIADRARRRVHAEYTPERMWSAITEKLGKLSR